MGDDGDRPRAARELPKSCIIRVSSPGSRPVVGSSRNSTLGRLSSSVATPVRLRWPPESEPIRVLGVLVERQLAEHALDRRVDLLVGHVLRQAQAGRVAQRLARR